MFPLKKVVWKNYIWSHLAEQKLKDTQKVKKCLAIFNGFLTSSNCHQFSSFYLVCSINGVQNRVF